MLRPTRVQSFGNDSSVERRFTAGSLNPATPDAEVHHFIRRRRSSAVGVSFI